MKNNKSTHNYSDIQRYVNGEMSTHEMRQLELASLDDPFLADALEGHKQSSVTVTNKHISEIETYVHSIKNETRIIPFYTKYKWLSVAAVVLIMAGAAWMTINLIDKPNDALAVNKTISSKKADTASATVNDAAEKINENAAHKQEPNSVTANANPKTQTLTSSRESKSPVSDAASGTALSPTAPASIAQSVPERQEAETKKYSVIPMITGQVKDNAGKPVAGATLKLEGNRGTTSDAKGNFMFPISDSNKTAEVTALGLAPKKVELKNSHNEILLNKETQTLDEVVVTGMASAKRRSMSAPSVITGLQIDTANVQGPIIGWNSFQKLLFEKIKTSTENFKSQRTVISFIVNKSKSVRRIKTEATDNDEVSEIISDFIESQEFWMPSQERIRLVIRIK